MINDEVTTSLFLHRLPAPFHLVEDDVEPFLARRRERIPGRQAPTRTIDLDIYLTDVTKLEKK